MVKTQEKPTAVEIQPQPANPASHKPTPQPASPSASQPMPRRIPFWASASIAINGLLLLGISLIYWKPEQMGVPMPAPVVEESAEVVPEASETDSIETDRQQLSYEEWLKVLEKEAKAAAQNKPERLTVLLGDSLSLWFPPELLSKNRNWLNQGISGDSTAGLLKRLKFLDEVQPQTILLMVGINDLIKGQSDEQVIDNYRQIIQALKQKHPKTELVIQSILPHGADRLSVEDREQVAKVSNERIFQLNQKLSVLSSENEVYFLNLYPLFVDGDGLLRQELSTDGLHLNEQGYLVWRSGLQVFDQLLLKQPEAKAAAVPASEKASEAATPMGEAKPESEEVQQSEVTKPEATAPLEPAQ